MEVFVALKDDFDFKNGDRSSLNNGYIDVGDGC